MFILSCFADEISPELEVQLEFLKRNNIHYMELRSVWGKNILELTENELNIIKLQLDKNGIKVSSIGSPIGKVDVNEDFRSYLDIFRRTIDIALKMESKYIRIFSFYIKKQELDIYEETVITRIKQMVEIAEEYGVTLLHENEADIFGETSERCKKMFSSINSAGFKAVFDPSNFVAAGEDVLNVSFENLKDYIAYMHIKDSCKDTQKIVIAGQGDGHIKEILDKLKNRESMFISLEPHLMYAGKYRGFSGPQLFQEDLDALKIILKRISAEYV